MHVLLYIKKKVAASLLNPEQSIPIVKINDKKKREDIGKSLIYLRDRIGVPRDMSYPAARQLRAYLNSVLKKI